MGNGQECSGPFHPPIIQRFGAFVPVGQIWIVCIGLLWPSKTLSFQTLCLMSCAILNNSGWSRLNSVPTARSSYSAVIRGSFRTVSMTRCKSGAEWRPRRRY